MKESVQNWLPLSVLVSACCYCYSHHHTSKMVLYKCSSFPFQHVEPSCFCQSGLTDVPAMQLWRIIIASLHCHRVTPCWTVLSEPPFSSVCFILFSVIFMRVLSQLSMQRQTCLRMYVCWGHLHKVLWNSLQIPPGYHCYSREDERGRARERGEGEEWRERQEESERKITDYHIALQQQSWGDRS